MQSDKRARVHIVAAKQARFASQTVPQAHAHTHRFEQLGQLLVLQAAPLDERMRVALELVSNELAIGDDLRLVDGERQPLVHHHKRAGGHQAWRAGGPQRVCQRRPSGV